MRIGLIQAGGIGDIIIALPIADFFLERGCQVHWPINDSYLQIFKPAKPEVNFIPIPRDEGWAYETPLARLNELGCERIIPLPNDLGTRPVCEPKLVASLKFDEYKYAIAGVPFARKWDLRIRRDLAREAALKLKLNISGPYICVHRHTSQMSYNIHLPQQWLDHYQIVDVSPITESPFDWITTFEDTSKLVMIDS